MTDEDIDDLVSWGFNQVRLGVMWEAVERQPGIFNQTYLDEVNSLIDRLGKSGIYTLVDMHQDVLSRATCGEGIPAFYAQDYLEKYNYCLKGTSDFFLTPILNSVGACQSFEQLDYRRDFHGWPLLEDCLQTSFVSYYATSDVISLFRGLYENIGGLQSKFLRYWEVISESFAHNPYVVGFDPLNEPMFAFDSIDHLVEKVIPTGRFDELALQPLYASIYKIL